jgi:hypothetical protein
MKWITFLCAKNTLWKTRQEKIKMMKCLEEEEIQYLEALYTRYRIKKGNRTIRFNKGVAQGSILSPALFNIFIEDLAERISRELQVNVEDILMYADDILILCNTPEQTEKCIHIIDAWSSDNGMQLNKKKSGIVVFAPRIAKQIPYMCRKEKEWKVEINDINGVPIVPKYKYLGTILDNKLVMKTQLNFIRKKADYLYVQLYPYLSNASADGRKDMWRTMVFPLFNAILIQLYFEPAINDIDWMIKLYHYTFKRFLMIPKTTNTEIIEEMIGLNLNNLVITNAQNAEAKWLARKNRRIPRL